jgi:hypothetical protein
MAAGQLIFVEAVEISQISTATGGPIGGVVDDGHSAPPRRRDMRVLLGSIDATLDDIPDDSRASLLDKTSYAHSQTFALARRSDNSDGIVYPSVRHAGGTCAAAFWPDVVGIPIQERHLKYEWDGNRVSRYFDFKLENWFDVPD